MVFFRSFRCSVWFVALHPKSERQGPARPDSLQGGRAPDRFAEGESEP